MLRTRTFALFTATLILTAFAVSTVAANDDCANATSITGEVLFETDTLATATPSVGITEVCGLSQVNADRWYVFTASDDVILRVSTCGSHDSPAVDEGTDTVLSVFDGCGGTHLECNDDWPDGSDVPQCESAALVDEGLPRDSAIARFVQSGETVYIRVSHYGPTAAGEYNFLAFVSPLNDDCEDALPAVPGTYTGNNRYATVDGASSCATGDAENDVWFEFTAPANGSLVASVNDTQYVSLHSGCPGDISTELACSESFGTGSVSLSMATGETVLVRVAPSVKIGTDFALILEYAVGVQFRRGDANSDGSYDISDAIFTLSGLFTSGTAPACDDSADANDDGMIDIGDAVFTLSSLFSGGAEPPGSDACDTDPTDDGLACDSYDLCP